jgi:hypothetical protein
MLDTQSSNFVVKWVVIFRTSSLIILLKVVDPVHARILQISNIKPISMPSFKCPTSSLPEGMTSARRLKCGLWL